MSEKTDWLIANTNLDRLTIEAVGLFDDGVSAKEIAKRLGFSRPGVYGRLQRAQRRWQAGLPSRRLFARSN